jgi:hypothetical protein
MLNRLKFRRNLFKLLILKNVIETKVHKENMVKMFVFERLIANTEEE